MPGGPDYIRVLVAVGNSAEKAAKVADMKDRVVMILHPGDSIALRVSKNGRALRIRRSSLLKIRREK